MKEVLVCNRCKATVEVQEGCQIGVCYSSLKSAEEIQKIQSNPKDRTPHYVNSTHGVLVNRSTDAGKDILAHIERKPLPQFAGVK